jgi:hypothetical protein
MLFSWTSMNVLSDPSARVGGKSVKSRCFGSTCTAEGSWNRFDMNIDTFSPR